MDTYGGLILPKLVTAYGIFLMTSLQLVPVELEEAARIDGASVFQMYLRGGDAAGWGGPDRAR